MNDVLNTLFVLTCIGLLFLMIKQAQKGQSAISVKKEDSDVSNNAR